MCENTRDVLTGPRYRSDSKGKDLTKNPEGSREQATAKNPNSGKPLDNHRQLGQVAALLWLLSFKEGICVTCGKPSNPQALGQASTSQPMCKACFVFSLSCLLDKAR